VFDTVGFVFEGRNLNTKCIGRKLTMDFTSDNNIFLWLQPVFMIERSCTFFGNPNETILGFSAIYVF